MRSGFFNYLGKTSYLPWTPLPLFAAGEQGAWYDPSDLSTLFQDAAGTIPVTAVGDPVGRMLDKSGRGNHAAQSVSAARPAYQTDGALHWLEFDGVDDFMGVSMDLTGSPNVQVLVGVYPGTPSTVLCRLLHFGGFSSGNFWLNCPNDASLSLSFNASGGTPRLALSTVPQYAAPHIFHGKAFLQDSFLSMQVDSRPVVSSSATMGGGASFASSTLRIGAELNGTKQYRGRVCSLIITNSQADLQSARPYMAAKAGVTL